MKASRRELLLGTAALGAAAIAGNACNEKPKLPEDDPRYQGLLFLVPIEARTVDAWIEQLLPADHPPGTPGARAANVLLYIDKQLAQKHFTTIARGVRRAAVILQRAAVAQGAAHFADLDAPAQRVLLERLQQNQLAAFAEKTNTAKTFDTVLLLALEGYLGDPSYGGNKDQIVWRALGDSPACPKPLDANAHRHGHHE
ncbi:MAG: gluconate 2-dehydrogenase subunit 3 family protein [Deltaproteobacteria bacterium]|nr:gluconate 2-dehydrogenase subunit 3 family protein [Deltaproteobacteria bacterium]